MTMGYRSTFRRVVAATGFGLAAAAAAAGDGKLLLTGGVSTIDGAAGGGLTPWAVTGSYAAAGEWGATAYGTAVKVRDYGLKGYGAALAWTDRVEFSIAHQDFDTKANLAPLGLAGLKLKMDIAGAKLRVAGDAIVDSDGWMPQIALGVLHKKVDAGALGPTLTGALGVKDGGTEFYVSATKLFLAPGMLVNATLRATKANQGGLLGFGGTQGKGDRLMPEFSVAWLANRSLAIGAEFRAKPNNLDPSALGDGALKEDDWADLFVAWAPNKNVSLTVAYVDLGKIVPALQPRRQTGSYVSAQFAF